MAPIKLVLMRSTLVGLLLALLVSNLTSASRHKKEDDEDDDGSDGLPRMKIDLDPDLRVRVDLFLDDLDLGNYSGVYNEFDYDHEEPPGEGVYPGDFFGASGSEKWPASPPPDQERGRPGHSRPSNFESVIHRKSKQGTKLSKQASGGFIGYPYVDNTPLSHAQKVITEEKYTTPLASAVQGIGQFVNRPDVPPVDEAEDKPQLVLRPLDQTVVRPKKPSTRGPQEKWHHPALGGFG
mgnify:CR=1 FL=1